MAIIKAFKAYRPRKGLESRIAALPYDVYSRQEACELVKDDEYSFLRIDRAETQFESTVDTYADCVYQKAHDMLWEHIKKGDFVQDEKECYYVYRQIMNGRAQTGLVALASIDDYMNQVIKKHENTRADKEADRIRHVDTCEAQTGPIFLAYRAQDGIRSVVSQAVEKEPVYDFISDDGIGHQVCIIDEKIQIDTIKEAFSKMDAIYIADGHHRCASAVKVGLMRRERAAVINPDAEYNFFLSVLFPDEELMIMDYNRVVHDLNGYTTEEFLEKLQKNFSVKVLGETAYKPEEKGCFGMYIEGNWYELRAKEDIKSKDPVKGLDVSILQDYLLNPILGIADPKTDKRIDFVGGIRGLEELKKRADTDMKVAFSMYPTSIHELFEVADANRLMPPKSTWFEPKLRSGLFIHSIKEAE